MASMENTLQKDVVEPKTTYLRDAQDAVKVRDGKFLDFEPLNIPGTPLSELIIRERHGK